MLICVPSCPFAFQINDPVLEHSYPARPRILRPPNAFMLFAQERRRSVAAQHPQEKNKQISTRLGQLWRELIAADREEYHRKAAETAREHRNKYPGEARSPDAYSIPLNLVAAPATQVRGRLPSSGHSGHRKSRKRTESTHSFLSCCRIRAARGQRVSAPLLELAQLTLIFRYLSSF